MGENPDARQKAIEVVRGMVGGDNLSSRYAMRYIDDVERAILAERERCAKIAESHDDGDPHSDYGNAARDIASAIRSGVEDGRG